MRQSLLVLLFYGAVAFVLMAPLSLDLAGQAANEGDPLQASWAMAWDAHQLIRSPFDLYDSNTFHPYANSLAFSESYLAQAISISPVFWLTGNALLSQNLAVLLALTLSGFSMFVFLRHGLGDRDAALVGGMLYAFTSYTLSEIPRVQILSLQWWPLAVVYLHRSLVAGRWQDRSLFGLFFLLQCLSCIYYVFYFSLALLVWAPGLFWWTTGRREGRNFLGLAPPVGVALSIVGLLALPYFRLSRDFGYERQPADGIDLLSYLAPPAETFLARWFHPTVHQTVSPHFVGLTALFLVAVALLRKPGAVLPGDARAIWKLSLITGLLAVLFAGGPTLYLGGEALVPGPYAFLYQYVPLVRAFRSPERMTVLVLFSVAVLGGYGASILLRAVPRRLSRILLVLLLSVAPLEHFQRGTFGVRVPTGARAPEVYRWLGEIPGEDPVVELPLYPPEVFRFFAAYMFYSTHHFKPIVFGRTSYYPPAHGYLTWQMRDFPDRDSLDLLRALGVTTIVVHPELWPYEARHEKLEALAAFPEELELLKVFPELEGEDYERFGLGSERVYRLREAEPIALTELCSPEDEIAPDRWTLQGYGGSGSESAAIDRNGETSWKTEGQGPGRELLVDLGGEETLAAIRLSFGYPYEEFPRHLVLADGDLSDTIAYRDDPVTKLELLEILLERPRDAAVTLRFEPRRLRQLRLIVGGLDPDPFLPNWQLRELQLYRSCR